MAIAKATIHGAISIVNAIATGKGAALGISKKVNVEMETSYGKGVIIEVENKSMSSRLINRVIEKIVTKNELSKTKLKISLDTEIPTGYGLKSSSAISTAVAMTCAKLFKPNMNDTEILNAGVKASIETKVSLTGAYDDACACYYGGFVVTDNYKKKLIRSEKCLNHVSAVIFIPKSRKRGNVKKLKTLSADFEKAWNLAKKSDYWNAMNLNGIATSTILSSEPEIILKLIENGAIGASVSGNGPSIAAIVENNSVPKIKKLFSTLEGKTTIAQINNKKAEVHEL
jgi:shikimate kinase